MTRVRLLLGLAGLVAVVFPASAAASPPFPNSTYDLFANGGLVGQLNIPADGDQPGATLGRRSFVIADCVASGQTLFRARVRLAGIPINNPAGVINAFPTRVLRTPESPGTLTAQFFIRWFPSVSSAPTQTPPMGAPGPGQTFSTPPGDIGTGTLSGRNNPTVPVGPGFCSFNLSFFAQKV
jgi:hypothetical protein